MISTALISCCLFLHLDVLWLPSQLPGGDPVQSHPRPQGLPLLRRARLQGHVLARPPPRRPVHLAGQHARGELLAAGRGRLADQPLRPHAAHVHLLPGLGRVQLHLQGDAERRRRDGETLLRSNPPWLETPRRKLVVSRLQIFITRETINSLIVSISNPFL